MMKNLIFIIAVTLTGTTPLMSQQPKPAPKFPNGTIDLSGVWLGGGSVGDISQGLPKGETLPLKEDAKKKMASNRAGDDPNINCLPNGVPRMSPYPWRIIQTPTHSKTTHIYFIFEGNYVDGKKYEKKGTITLVR